MAGFAGAHGHAAWIFRITCRSSSTNASAMTIFENEHFDLKPCYTCPLPGNLILSAKVPSDAIHDMPLAAASALGPTLAAISRSIQTVLTSERIYTPLFCEAQRGVHFHIFPRTAWLREAYLTRYTLEKLIDGPRLLSWARRTFTQPIPEFEPANKAIQELLTSRLHRKPETMSGNSRPFVSLLRSRPSSPRQWPVTRPLQPGL